MQNVKPVYSRNNKGEYHASIPAIQVVKDLCCLGKLEIKTDCMLT